MYRPASKMKSLSVETPDSMFFEGQIALSKLKEYLRNEYGDEMTVDEYVKMHLRYKSLDELSNALAAEQVDQRGGLAGFDLVARDHGDRGQGFADRAFDAAGGDLHRVERARVLGQGRGGRQQRGQQQGNPFHRVLPRVHVWP